METDKLDDCVFNICFINVCGLKSKLQNGVFEKYISNFDFVCVAESKLDNAHDASNIGLPEGFKILCKNRHALSAHPSGGVALLAKDSVFSLVSEVVGVSNDVLWCLLDKEKLGTDRSILMGIGYVSPEGTKYSDIESFDKVEQDIVELVEKFDCEVLLIGDFNAHCGKLSDTVDQDAHINEACGVPTGENAQYGLFDPPDGGLTVIERTSMEGSPVNNFGHRLTDLCKSVGLILANGRVGADKGIGRTTCKKSVDDVLLVSPKAFVLIDEFCIDDFNPLLSDVHNPLTLSLKMKRGPFTQNENNQITETGIGNLTEPEPRNVPRWKNDQSYAFVNNIDANRIHQVMGLLLNENVNQASIDEATSEISALFVNAAKLTFPTNKASKNKPRSTRHKKWFDRECKASRNDFERLHNAYRGNKTETNYTLMKAASKTHKKQLAKSYNKYRKDLTKKLRDLKSSNPKDYWNVINKKSNDGLVKASVEAFRKHFSKLNEAPDDHLIQDTGDHGDILTGQVNEMLNKPITSAEILKVIRKLKNNKACGSDSIINEEIKASQNVMIDVYTRLFNRVFDSGIIPTEWSKGTIKPIYKNKGSKLDPDNYRGITILSCLGKVFTGVINNRLNDFASSSDLIGREQAGFRPKHSTVDHIFVMKCLLDIYLSKGGKLFCAFVDYKKAFDTVWRAGLWQKMIRSGINGKLLEIVKSMYNSAKSNVEINGVSSDFFQCSVGVRQGENLSPFLFAIYLNDLEEFLVSKEFEGLKHLQEYSLCDFVRNIGVRLKLLVILYADDTIILADTHEGLQKGLNALFEYCKSWKLTVNATKTKVLIFSRGKSKKKVDDFTFGESVLEIISEYTYLGVTFSFNGKFGKARKRLHDLASKALYGLISKCRKLDLPLDICMELFDRMITPILTYGSEVWGYEDYSLLERLHLKFIKTMLKISKFTPSVMVYGEVGKFPIECVIKSKMVMFWNGLLDNSSNKWSQVLYNIVLEHDKKGYLQSEWCSHIRKILNDCGLSYLWQQQNHVNKEWLKKTIKIRLEDQYKQQWLTACDENPKCSNYRIYANHSFQKYLTLLPENLRVPLTKYRLSNSRLPGVLARNYNNTDDNTICTQCNTGDIGDEFHYLFNCPQFNQARRSYLKNYFCHHPNALKFNSLMNKTNYQALRKLAIFCNVIQKKLLAG